MGDPLAGHCGSSVNRFMRCHVSRLIWPRRLSARHQYRFVRDAAAIAREAALDGFYVLRTSVPAETLDATTTVSAYKNLAHVERAFRALKSIDLGVRPVHHRLAGRVRAHVFLCMLAYYVAWHMRRELAPLLFEDHDRETAAVSRGSPVARAQVSPAARAKARTRKTDDGEPVHSCRTLLADLATLATLCASATTCR